MITRLVKLTISEEKIIDFKNIFEMNQMHIQAFEGCEMVEVFQDIHNKNIFFTHSRWNSEKDLNNYRESELFKRVWAETKKTFAGRPEAWSLK